MTSREEPKLGSFTLDDVMLQIHSTHVCSYIHIPLVLRIILKYLKHSSHQRTDQGERKMTSPSGSFSIYPHHCRAFWNRWSHGPTPPHFLTTFGGYQLLLSTVTTRSG